MKQKNIQQEVLLYTETSLVRKILIDKNGHNENASKEDELEQAVWNGLLDEMLPEIMQPVQRRKSELFIWKINTEENSLMIDLAEAPDIIEYPYSINPCLFLSETRLN